MPLSQFILFIFMSLQHIRHSACCSWGKDFVSPGEMLLSSSCPPKPLAAVGWGLGAELQRVHARRPSQASKDCLTLCISEA